MTIHGANAENKIDFAGLAANQKPVGYFHARGFAVARELVELDLETFPIDEVTSTEGDDYRKAFAARDPKTGEATVVTVISQGEHQTHIDALMANPEKPVQPGELQRFVGAALHLTGPNSEIGKLDIEEGVTNIPAEQLEQVAGKVNGKQEFTFVPIGPGRIHRGFAAA